MKFVTRLNVDGSTEADPTWEDVEAAIEDLDANEVTLVTLAPSAPLGPDHHMAIGGGKDDRYVVYLSENNLRFWNLEDPTKAGSTARIRMLVGGQPGDYREAQCVSKDWAVRAARVYFELGARAADLAWRAG